MTTKRSKLLALLVATGLAGITLTFPVGTVSASPPDSGQKVSICHGTNSDSNPYVQIEVDEASVDGQGGADHYGGHKGPVWNPTLKAQKIEWGDIIPPVPGSHGGLNWDAAGQVIYRNECQIVVPATTTTIPVTTTTVPPTTTIVPPTTTSTAQSTTTTTVPSTTTTVPSTTTTAAPDVTTTTVPNTTTTTVPDVTTTTTTTVLDGTTTVPDVTTTIPGVTTTVPTDVSPVSPTVIDRKAELPVTGGSLWALTLAGLGLLALGGLLLRKQKLTP